MQLMSSEGGLERRAFARGVETVVVTSAPVPILAGDIDRDNSVTVFDYDILSQNFDVNSANPSWNTPGDSGHAPRECDLDEDGAITVFDYDLLSSRFDKKGEVY